MDLLRFITAGSVDDGKSTLIGRLLYDSDSVSLDVMEAVQKAGKTREGTVDLALLTDGLRAEREQGITIDVAYKYFTTSKRKFIIADAPGHVQYTRNMVTGASNCNLAIILIDARNGVVEQTRRHSIISSLLGIPHLVIAINKMDLVDYSKEVFDSIVEDYENFSAQLGIKDIVYIPVSARMGDNIVTKAENMNWYEGKCLLHHLEEVHVDSDINLSEGRFPVQFVIRPQTDGFHDYRGYAGRITSGIYKKGMKVEVLPAGFSTKISKIESNMKEVEEAFAPMSVILHLEDDIDISRGDMIVPIENMPELSQDIFATICWMDARALKPGAKFLIQHNTKRVKCAVREIRYKIDIESLNKEDGIEEAKLNDLCGVEIRTAEPLAFDSYTRNRYNGAFILIDENTCATVAAGMID